MDLKECVPKENGLTCLEEFILLEINKNSNLPVGQLIGHIYTYYGQIPIEVIHQTLVNLVTPIPIIKFSVPLENLTFTNETVSFTSIGNTFVINEETNEITNPYPIRLLRNYKCIVNNIPIYMFGFSTVSLYNTLLTKDSTMLDFNTLSGVKYLNESDVKPFVLNGKVSELQLMKKYEYTDYNNLLKIKNNVYQVKLPKDYGYEKQDLLYKLGIFKELTLGVVVIRDNRIELDHINGTLESVYFKNDSLDLEEFKRIFIDEFEGVDTQKLTEDYRSYFMYFNGETKTAWVTCEELEDSLYTYKLEIDNNNDYIAIAGSEHLKLDLLKYSEFREVNGIFALPKFKPDSNIEHYFINDKGELKISNEIKLWTRNKRVSSTEISKDTYLIHWFSENNPTNEGRILFITEKGIIKIIDLLEYKSKSRNSQYVRGLNLIDGDKIVHCEYLPLCYKMISVLINDEVTMEFEINSLVSSKVNKGKKIKYKSDITTIKVDKS